MFGVEKKYILFCLVGLVICLWGFHRQVLLVELPDDFTVSENEWPVQADGIEVGSLDELRFIVEGYSPGEVLHLSGHAGLKQDVILVRAFSPLHGVATFICGMLTWVLCLIVFAPRAPFGVGRDFFWCNFLFCNAIMIGGVYFPRGALWPGAALGLIQLAAIALLGPQFVHLSLNFPRRSSIQDRFRWLMPLLILFALILILWRGTSYILYITDPGSEYGRLLMPALRTGDALIVMQVLLALLIMFSERRFLELTRERKQIKWLLWGMSLGALPYVVLRALPRLFGAEPVLPTEIDRFLELAIPGSFAFAVVRFRFLDIDIIIRRSVIYAILAAAIAAICLIPGILMGRWLYGDSHLRTLLPLIATGVLAGVLFFPLKQLIGRFVDRFLFKIKSDYDQALRLLKINLQQVSDQQELTDQLAVFLHTALRPKSLLVIIRDRTGTELYQSYQKTAPPDSRMESRLQSAITSEVLPHEQARDWCDQWPLDNEPDEFGGRIIAKHESSSLPEIEADRFPESLAEAGFVLGELVLHDGNNAGLILLGARQTERRYIETDIDLIRECGALAESVLRRINLVQMAADELQARRRLDELNELKSEFLSQVSHDLRTPVTSIAWSVDNLLDGIVGGLNESQIEYLQSVKTSASHLNKLVGNLLEISRLEQKRVELNLLPLKLTDLFAEAILSMKAVAAEKQVEIRLNSLSDQAGSNYTGSDKAGSEQIACVSADHQRLVEVIINLLDNAIKYSPPAAVVDLTIQSQTGGDWLFSVKDSGPGFKHEQIAKVFNRFSQGTPSPYSQRHGFGLGLYIVRSYLELMGGGVTAENHPDGGAVVTGRLKSAEDI